MKARIIPFSIVLFVLLFSTCRDDKEVREDDNGFSGYYKITSIYSSKQIDMNNDGLKSNDILSEISGCHVLNNGEVAANMFNTDHPQFFAEVRPLSYHKNDVKLIDFKYPYQAIIDNDGYLDPYLMCYSGKFLGYSYNLGIDNQIEITGHSEYGMVNSASRINENSFWVNISIRLYDFKEKKWIDTDIDVKYIKAFDM